MTQGTTGDALGGLTATLMPLINGFMASRVVHVAAELGIADLLAQGAKSSEVLARETGTYAPSLRRLLRALASLGVIDELEPGRFALNAMGAQLRSGVPDSVRNLALTFGSERAWRSWGELRHSILTGAPAMRQVFGMDSFDYLAAHPKRRRSSTRPWPRSRAKSPRRWSRPMISRGSLPSSAAAMARSSLPL